MNLSKTESVGLLVIIFSLLTTGVVGGIYIYDYGYQSGVNNEATAYALEVSIMSAQITELNDTNIEYYSNIGYKQARLDENAQILADLRASQETLFDEAYSAGYESAAFENGNILESTYESGWWDGYDEGYVAGAEDTGVYDTYNTGYEAGYDNGLEEGLYISNSDAGVTYATGYENGYNKAISDLVGDGYTTALGDYTMTFRDLYTGFEPYYYHSDYVGETQIRMLVGNTTLTEAPFNFVGSMDTVLIIDFHDPEGNLIAVGGLFGHNLAYDMAPLVKP